LRAALKMFKTMIPDDQRAWAAGEIKWIARALGAQRNWDVFADLLTPVQQAFAADRDLAALSRAAAELQHLGHEQTRAMIDANRYTDFALQLLTWVDTRSWRQQAVSEDSVRLLSPIGGLAPALLHRRFRKVRKLAKTLDLDRPEQRHRLRIALKELRYAVDFLAPIYDAKTARRYVKRLAALQDDFGLLQDIATIDALAQQLPQDATDADLARGAAIMLGWYGHVAAMNAGSLGKKLRRLLKAEPFWEQAA
jgi:CHAD domain-containing protein